MTSNKQIDLIQINTRNERVKELIYCNIFKNILIVESNEDAEKCQLHCDENKLFIPQIFTLQNRHYHSNGIISNFDYPLLKYVFGQTNPIIEKEKLIKRNEKL